MRWWIIAIVAVGGLAFWLGRQSLPELRERFVAATPHEAYERRLRDAGLDQVAAGRLWQRAAARALTDAPRAEAPFRETGYLDPERPEAVGYRFRAEAGRRLRVELDLEPPTNALVFLDLFRIPTDTTRAPVRVASAEEGQREIVHEPNRDADYLVRVQPELLRGGRYTLRVSSEPTMAFPVFDADLEDVHSVFGDPRDGGDREHHGIDIFAERGTPVVAAAAGQVRSVRTTPRGGRVVWLRDEGRGQSIYYAHLEAQLVEPGARVSPGDTLGLVGNSGNARTTPPHLHFGIYRRGVGPLDPLPFVRPAPAAPPPQILADAAAGSLRRVTEEVVLRAAPTSRAPEMDRLESDTPVRVAAVAGEWLRVEVGDGRHGFIAGRFTAPAAPLRSAALTGPTPLRDRPLAGGVEVARLDAGERVEVLGRLGDHLYVRAPGREAWMPAEGTR
jgi:murein DD-endopeptidase MepM/ murein hydrolase activator NlpD